MTELRKVSGPSSLLDRHAGRLIVLVVIAVLIAIVKPWGAAVRPVPVAATSPSPSAVPTPLVTARPRLYDFLSFGTNQPPPRWEMWPAGNLASFTFAMRVDLEAAVAASPDPSARPTPTATPVPVGSSGGGPAGGIGAIPDPWPTIRIPVGSNLDLLGINSPLGFTVRVIALRRVGEDGSLTPAHAVIGASPWPDHFTIIGYGPEGGPDAMQPWPAGTYRLDLGIDPGGITRTVEVVIEGPAPGGSAGPAETPAASAVASGIPPDAAP